MKNLFHGSMIRLSDERVDPAGLIALEFSVVGNTRCNFLCFCLDGQGRLADEQYLVFFNNISSPNREVQIGESQYGANFHAYLSYLPQNIQKLVFTVSPEGGGTMRDISACKLQIKQNNNAVFQLDFTGYEVQGQKSVIILEFEKRDSWYLNTPLSGFNGGMEELLQYFQSSQAAASPAQGNKAVKISTILDDPDDPDYFEPNPSSDWV